MSLYDFLGVPERAKFLRSKTGLSGKHGGWSEFAIPDPLEGRISFGDGFVIPNNLHHMNMLLLETKPVEGRRPRPTLVTAGNLSQAAGIQYLESGIYDYFFLL